MAFDQTDIEHLLKLLNEELGKQGGRDTSVVFYTLQP